MVIRTINSLQRLPEPSQSSPGEVLLSVRFAALNPADAFLAQAMYPAKPPLPHILGRDGVGDVLAVGPEVDKGLMGRTVGVLRSSVGVEAWGTLAEKVVVPAVDIVPVPQGWTYPSRSRQKQRRRKRV
jgi:NADPH:quinone reductase